MNPRNTFIGMLLLLLLVRDLLGTGNVFAAAGKVAQPEACSHSQCDALEKGKLSLSSDVVVDAETAVKVAEVVLPTIYGERVLGQRPFKAVSSGNRWRVEGTLHGGENARGGVAHIEFRKSDMKVTSVGHGK